MSKTQFIDEIDAVCKKYNLSICGCEIIIRNYNREDIVDLINAPHVQIPSTEQTLTENEQRRNALYEQIKREKQIIKEQNERRKQELLRRMRSE